MLTLETSSDAAGWFTHAEKSAVEQSEGTLLPAVQRFASKFAEATGIARPVVYSAVSRLAAAGRLHKRSQDDGQVSYEVAA